MIQLGKNTPILMQYAFKGHAVRGHLGTYTLGQGHESSLVMEGQGRVMASRHAAWVMEGRADFS